MPQKPWDTGSFLGCNQLGNNSCRAIKRSLYLEIVSPRVRLASIFPQATIGTFVRPHVAWGVRQWVPADMLTKLEHISPITHKKAPILPLNMVISASLTFQAYTNCVHCLVQHTCRQHINIDSAHIPLPWDQIPQHFATRNPNPASESRSIAFCLFGCGSPYNRSNAAALCPWNFMQRVTHASPAKSSIKLYFWAGKVGTHQALVAFIYSCMQLQLAGMLAILDCQVLNQSHSRYHAEPTPGLLKHTHFRVQCQKYCACHQNLQWGRGERNYCFLVLHAVCQCKTCQLINGKTLQ